MAELAELGGGNLFLEVALIVGSMVSLFGLILFLCVVMDMLGARFGGRGFFGALVAIGVAGGAGGLAGWEIREFAGAFLGAYVVLALAITVAYLALRRREERTEDGE